MIYVGAKTVIPRLRLSIIDEGEYKVDRYMYSFVIMSWLLITSKAYVLVHNFPHHSVAAYVGNVLSEQVTLH